MALLTKANPLEALRLHALISGSAPAKPKAPKRKGKVTAFTRYVTPIAWSDAVQQVVVIQYALRLSSDQYNANGSKFSKSSEAKKHVDTTLEALRLQLAGLSGERFTRERIRGVVFTRIAPVRIKGDDNLTAAFKHVRDATFAWIVYGDQDFDRRKIGIYDDDVNTPGGHTCSCEQTVSAEDKRAYGIQIRFSF